jgi:hypothetical protein
VGDCLSFVDCRGIDELDYCVPNLVLCQEGEEKEKRVEVGEGGMNRDSEIGCNAPRLYLSQNERASDVPTIGFFVYIVNCLLASQ